MQPPLCTRRPPVAQAKKVAEGTARLQAEVGERRKGGKEEKEKREEGERGKQSDREPRAVQRQKKKDRERKRKSEHFTFTDRPTKAHLPPKSKEL